MPHNALLAAGPAATLLQSDIPETGSGMTDAGSVALGEGMGGGAIPTGPSVPSSLRATARAKLQVAPHNPLQYLPSRSTAVTRPGVCCPVPHRPCDAMLANITRDRDGMPALDPLRPLMPSDQTQPAVLAADGPLCPGRTRHHGVLCYASGLAFW